MTQVTNPTREVKVTQADREAARELVGSCFGASEGWMHEVREGHYDTCAPVQAFARHRLTASTPPVPDVSAIPVGMKLVPADDDGRDFADSALPEAMIEAGTAAYERAQADMLNYVSGETIDWDAGMIVVAIYRAMLAASPPVATGSGDALPEPYVRDQRANLVRWIREAIERADQHGSTEGVWFFADQWRVALAALGATHPTTAAHAVERDAWERANPFPKAPYGCEGWAKYLLPQADWYAAKAKFLRSLSPTTAADTGSTEGVGPHKQTEAELRLWVERNAPGAKADGLIAWFMEHGRLGKPPRRDPTCNSDCDGNPHKPWCFNAVGRFE